MKFDVVLLNWIFIYVTTVCTLVSLWRVFKYTSKTIADYTLLVVYVFCCLPVLFDLVIGVPEYVYWYKPFENLIADFEVCVIYNLYIGVTVIILTLYAYFASRSTRSTHIGVAQIEEWRSFAVDIALIISPVIIVLIRYGPGVLMGYTTLSRKGLASSDVSIINQLIMVSVYFYVTRFFTKNRNKREYLLMMLFFFVLTWINGKRYIIITIIEEMVYMYQLSKRAEKKRISLWVWIPILGIVLVVFSVYYLSSIKVTQAVDYMYGSLRVDFGRDDVTKFAIYKVLLRGERIVEYPGQTFLSAIFMFVPRRFWPNKPYPHYRYLTASILNTSVLDIPAGTTPSLFEMSVCNFGWLGLVFTPLVLIWICWAGDRNKGWNVKLFCLLLITNILTQALDAITSLIVVLVVSSVWSRIFASYKVRIKGL